MPTVSSALLLASWLALAAGPAAPSPAAAPVPSGPSAAGYVADRECAVCHRDEARSFRDVGMGRSFVSVATAVRQGRLIEDFDAPATHHAPSRRWYRIVRRGDGLVFRRWQLDASGREINVFEQPIEDILGSGNHSRVYLYRTPAGELYQLPLAWYSQENGGRGGWAMAPGYDRPDHSGVTRLVRRECMFCHDAYPDLPAGGDSPGAPQLFPAVLPEGIGCQRCHGPGADHVRLALSPDAPSGLVRDAIVNPARLTPRLRDDVCYQCHMLPSVAIPWVRRFGRGDFSFRPGEALADYRVRMDVREVGRQPGERFEIDHQAYRLEQSRCFQASGGALSCLTCHDPHRKVPAAERGAHYRKACLGCHAGDLSGHPAVVSAELPGAAGGDAADPSSPEVSASDCVACHMPRRRAEDVVHAVMTDHRIQRPPADPAALLAPRKERDPDLADLVLADPEQAPAGRLGAVYRALAAVHGGVAVAGAVDYLETNLAAAAPEATEAWLDLSKGEIRLGRWRAAEETARRALARTPDDPATRELLAVALAGQGKHGAAEAVLRALVSEDPERPEALFNLGLILLGEGRPESALPFLRRAVDLRPNLATAWDSLGAAELALHRPDEASRALRRALEIDPTRTSAYLRLADALLATDRRDEAVRYLRVGSESAAAPAEVEARLDALESGGRPAQGERR